MQDYESDQRRIGRNVRRKCLVYNHNTSGIYYHNESHQNLSEQDVCFDSKDLIDSERNAVYLDDQRDSKGKISFISVKEGFPKVHDVSLGRNVLNQQPKFPAKVVLSNEI